MLRANAGWSGIAGPFSLSFSFCFPWSHPAEGRGGEGEVTLPPRVPLPERQNQPCSLALFPRKGKHAKQTWRVPGKELTPCLNIPDRYFIAAWSVTGDKTEVRSIWLLHQALVSVFSHSNIYIYFIPASFLEAEKQKIICFVR